MKYISFLISTFIFLTALTGSTLAQITITGADGEQVKITDRSRIITIGSSVTETVFALGVGEQVVAVDQSSTYPKKVNQLPKVPYIRSMSAEGVLAHNPSLIISSKDIKPETVVKQLRSAGVPVLLVPTKSTPEGTIEKITLMGKALGQEQEAVKIVSDIRSKLDQAVTLRAKIKQKPTVLFLLSAGSQGRLMAAGSNSTAQSMIEMAGGTNVFSNFQGYKPVSSEAVASANSEVILMMSGREHQVGGNNGFKNMPGIRLTKAAKNDQIITMNGNYLLGFGPRLGDAVLELMKNLYPELSIKP